MNKDKHHHKLQKLSEQYGGGGIPFSELREKKRSTRRKQRSRKLRSRKRTSRKLHSRKRRSRKLHSRKRRTRKLHSRKRTSRKRYNSKKKHSKKKSGKCECGNHSYTGKEETPRGLGHCEECKPLGIIILGKDGNYYENQKKGWKKIN